MIPILVLLFVCLFASDGIAQWCDIGAKVCNLQAGYDPVTALNNPNQTPHCSGPNADGATLIAQAFAVAPDKVKADLCTLNNIFIFSSPDHSWGKWEDIQYYPQPHCKDTLGNNMQCSFVGLNVMDLNRNIAAQENAHLTGLGINSAYHSHMGGNAGDSVKFRLWPLSHTRLPI